MVSLLIGTKSIVINSLISLYSISVIQKLVPKTFLAYVNIATGTMQRPIDLSMRRQGKLTDQE
jgi:hypothetical protein